MLDTMYEFFFFFLKERKKLRNHVQDTSLKLLSSRNGEMSGQSHLHYAVGNSIIISFHGTADFCVVSKAYNCTSTRKCVQIIRVKKEKGTFTS